MVRTQTKRMTALKSSPLWLESVDKFVTTPLEMAENHADMEAITQASICNTMGIPFMAVKVTSDWAGNTSTEVWEKALEECSVITTALINRVAAEAELTM